MRSLLFRKISFPELFLRVSLLARESLLMRLIKRTVSCINIWWPRVCLLLSLRISTHLLNSSFISSTLDGWQQMAQEDWAGSNNGAMYVFPTLIRSDKDTWEILVNKVLRHDKNKNYQCNVQSQATRRNNIVVNALGLYPEAGKRSRCHSEDRLFAMK